MKQILLLSFLLLTSCISKKITTTKVVVKDSVAVVSHKSETTITTIDTVVIIPKDSITFTQIIPSKDSISIDTVIGGTHITIKADSTGFLKAKVVLPTRKIPIKATVIKQTELTDSTVKTSETSKTVTKVEPKKSYWWIYGFLLILILILLIIWLIRNSLR